MHVGMCTIFQNPNQHTSDKNVYKNDVRLAEMAEPLGFDSVWTVEHHFTDYTMCPDPLQFLTYMAGRTYNNGCSNDPITNFNVGQPSDGRLILGLGRGAKSRIRRFPTRYGRLAASLH